MSAQRNSYTCKITDEQRMELEQILKAKNWSFSDAPYAHWRVKHDDVAVIAYESGKLVIQGKGTSEFVQFVLEPQVLKEARFGYEDVLAEEADPAMFTPHAGIDESGKGDFFGPMVAVAAYVDAGSAKRLHQAGITDSKAIKSDKRIQDLAQVIREENPNSFAVVTIGNDAYNRLHHSMGTVNRILGWAHARALEDLLSKVPDCPRAVADQFGNPRTIKNALMKQGQSIELEQRHKAESDIAVAAASIIAREVFIERMAKLGEELGTTLPRGASAKVLDVGRDLVKRHGETVLECCAKLHFKTTQKILGTYSA